MQSSKKDSYEVPAIFKMMEREGNVEEHMMYNTYNMGIGMIVAVDPADVEKTMEAMRATGDTPYVIGEIKDGEKRSNFMLKVAVLVSGGGTNLQAILDAIDNGTITNAKSGSCDQQQQKCIRFRTCEKNHGIEALCISPKDYGTRDAFNKAFLEKLDDCQPDLIVLAGFFGCDPEADDRKIQKPYHQYPSIPDPIFLRNRLLRTESP